MSYEVVVWEGTAPSDDDAALASYCHLKDRWRGPEVEEAIWSGGSSPHDPTPIAGYVAALVQRWPDSGPELDESPWADAPLMNLASGPLFCFQLVCSKLVEGADFAVRMAKEHELVCFDPQVEGLVTYPLASTIGTAASWGTPASATSRPKRWWRR